MGSEYDPGNWTLHKFFQAKFKAIQWTPYCCRPVSLHEGNLWKKSRRSPGHTQLRWPQVASLWWLKTHRPSHGTKKFFTKDPYSLYASGMADLTLRLEMLVPEPRREQIPPGSWALRHIQCPTATGWWKNSWNTKIKKAKGSNKGSHKWAMRNSDESCLLAHRRNN